MGKNRQRKWYHFSRKRVKIAQQKWYHFRKGSKILNKNGTISEKGQKSSTKMVPFQKRVKNPQQKWYHFRKWSKFLNKMVPFQAVKGQNSSTKMVPFQKRVKNPQQKWYHDKERWQDFHIKLFPWDKG